MKHFQSMSVARSDYYASRDPRYSATHFSLIEPRLAGITPLATRTAEVITQTAMTTNTNKSVRSVVSRQGWHARPGVHPRSFSQSLHPVLQKIGSSRGIGARAVNTPLDVMPITGTV